VSAELKPVYLLSGGDRPKIERALARLRTRFAEDAVESLSAHEASVDDVVAACNALGLFGGGRLVVVEHVDAWKAADAKALASYLADPAPGTVLALVGDGLKRDAALVRTCAKTGDTLFYDVRKRELPKWVGEQFRRLGAEAGGPACRALVEFVGDDLHALANEVEKLAAWAAGEPIAEGDVERLAVPHGDPPLFALADAWGTRHTAAVLRACDDLIRRSDEGPARSVQRIVGALTRHVSRVRACQALAEHGVRAGEAAGRLGLHPYVAEKAFAHGRVYSRDELEEALVRLADLDLALKGASRLPPELELERACVEITAGAEPGLTRRGGLPQPA
jgi:DNA polymerase III subunit delta